MLLYFTKYRLLLIGLIVLCFGTTSHAQSLAQKNASQRYNIDAKRAVTDMYGDDALPRAREFIRLDSTYYVGWMYEGMYKANFAADFLGYKNAVEPLTKALTLLEHDYAPQLKTRTGNLAVFYPAYRFQFDYNNIAYQLMECLSNINEPDKVYQLIRRAQKWNFQNEGPFQTYCYLAWITHRNRFYTSSKYAFLKNTVIENEVLSQRYLDSAMLKIGKDASINHFFTPDFFTAQKQSVYHYRAILYSYNLQIDSARRYYNLMKDYPYFSHNNYANFLALDGDFRDAYQEYKTAEMQDNGDKRLQEWAYFSSILDIYQARPQVGINALREMIKAVGSTPGYGWYNIALARCCTYNGNIDESERYLTKAEGFKEVHIGTTLGQSQYDFSINLVKLMNLSNHIQMLKFENDNWWYNPSKLADISALEMQKYLLQYLVVNQLAMNPEREMVIYKLFSSESTVSWDEVWFLIKDFTTNYFLKKYQFEEKNDTQRQKIKRYFAFFVAKLQMEKGDYDKAAQTLNQIINTPSLDTEYEKIFIARVYEAMALCAKENDQDEDYNKLATLFYTTFPQLVPFSDIKPPFYLTTSGNTDDKVVSVLKDCNINWQKKPSIYNLIVNLRFGIKGNKKSIIYSVVDRNGKAIVPEEEYVYSDASKAGKDMAYRLFNIKPLPPLGDSTTAIN